jgi:hypothetical protein
MRNIETFLEVQWNGNGNIETITLLDGIESDNDLMNNEFGSMANEQCLDI